MSSKKNVGPRTLLSLERFFVASQDGNVDALQEILGSSQVGIDINQVGSDGKTALFHAIVEQRILTVELLLKFGADVNLCSHVSYHKDHGGGTLKAFDEPPVVTAARIGSAGIVATLLDAGALPDIQAECHWHPSLGNIRDRTALHFACEEGNIDMVQSLLNQNAEVNIEDKQRETPLHSAVRCKHFMCDKQCEIVRLLCEHGSDVDQVNKIECSPLYLASFYACLQKVKVLLLYGADVNKFCERESSYGSPLHIAAIKDRMALAEVLVANGSKMNIKNSLGYTPLQHNINSHHRSDIASLLIYHGADMNGLDKYNFTLLAAVIRNMRLDCESLAKLMVYGGYDLSQDLWLRPGTPQQVRLVDDGEIHEIPCINIPDGRVRFLCDWLLEKQQNPRGMMEACRITIRRQLSLSEEGRSIEPGVLALPLPNVLKDYLLLKDIHH